MKKFHFCLVFSALFLFSCSKSTYQAAFTGKAANHKKIAILPFQIQLDYNELPPDFTPELVAEKKTSQAVYIQKIAYNQLVFSRRQLTVDIQDVERTNQLLKDSGISFQDAWKEDKARLASLLHVDAVVIGTLRQRKIMDNATAIGIYASTGGGIGQNNLSNLLLIPTNSAFAQLEVFDGAEGSMIWANRIGLNGNLVSSPESLIYTVIAKSSRRFPYTPSRIKRH